MTDQNKMKPVKCPCCNTQYFVPISSNSEGTIQRVLGLLEPSTKTHYYCDEWPWIHKHNLEEAVRLLQKEIGEEEIQKHKKTCLTCNGHGKIYQEAHHYYKNGIECRMCNGNGEV